MPAVMLLQFSLLEYFTYKNVYCYLYQNEADKISPIIYLFICFVLLCFV